MPPSQTGAWREFVSMGHGYAGIKCAAHGLAVGLTAGLDAAGTERAQKGAKDPRPVWIGAGVVAVQV